MTPKANWKELVAANDLKELPISLTLSHTYKGVKGNFETNPVYDVFTDESMPVIANCIAAFLHFDGKGKGDLVY